MIIVLYEGEAVELTGPASEEWQPLICASVQGYVHNDFVLLEGESPLEPAPVEEVPAEEVPTEEVPVEEVPVTEAPTEEVPVEDVPTEEIPVEDVPTEEVPVNDEVPTEEVPVDEAPVDEEPVFEAPAEDVPTEEIPVTDEPVEETPVTEPEPTEEVETPVVEDPTEVPTEEAETPVATEEPVETETPVATEEPTEEPTEVPTVEVEPTPVPTVAVPEIETEEAEAIQQTFTAAIDTSAADATGYAVVAGTNGDGVRCRASGSTNAPIITVLPEGTEVALRGSASGDWQPVVCAKSNGFVHTDYLAKSDGGGDITAAVGSDGEFTAAAITGTAVVSGTGGGGLRCRSSASYSGNIITVLAEGSKVNLNGSAQGEWQPVICGGKNGFAHVDYLTKSASSSKSTTSAASNTGTGSSGSAKVTGTNGDGVRCRSSASYSGNIITVLAEGATVTLRGATQGEWTPVTCAGKSGFVHKDYLTKTSGSTSGGSTSGGGTSAASSGTAKVTGTGGGGLNCRSSASSSGSVLMVLSEGATVTLRGAAQGSWQPIVCGGKNGFATRRLPDQEQRRLHQRR